jgi:hypothetical protein
MMIHGRGVATKRHTSAHLYYPAASTVGPRHLPGYFRVVQIPTISVVLRPNKAKYRQDHFANS